MRQVERRHVGGVVEHGAQLRREELDLLVAQVEPGQAGDVDDVLPARKPGVVASCAVAAGRRSANSTVRASISSLSQSSVATWKLRSSMTCSTGPLARATSFWLETGSTTWSWTLVKTRTGQATDSRSRLDLGRGAEERERGPQRESGVGRLDRTLHRDVRPDAGRDLVAAVDHRLNEAERVGIGRREKRVHDGDGGDLGVMLGQPDAQHAAHGQPDDHDAVAARRQSA